MLLTKLTAVYCQSYGVYKPNFLQNVQILNVTACGLYNMKLLCIKGSSVPFREVQYATRLTRQRAMSINSLTITLHKPLTHFKRPLMETDKVFKCQTLHLVT